MSYKSKGKFFVKVLILGQRFNVFLTEFLFRFNDHFYSTHTQVEIQPKFFLKVPLLFAPKSKGSHEATIVFTSLSDPQTAQIKVVIKGDTL